LNHILLSYFREIIFKLNVKDRKKGISDLLRTHKIEVNTENLETLNEFLQETQASKNFERSTLDDQINMQGLFDEISYNFCLACLKFQCVSHSESNQDNNFTLKRPVGTNFILPYWPKD
jgi:aspartate carbamoyltransferase regulatory subunit